MLQRLTFGNRQDPCWRSDHLYSSQYFVMLTLSFIGNDDTQEALKSGELTKLLDV